MMPQTDKRIPVFPTGFAQSSISWIAQHGDGWIQYPKPPQDQAQLINDYRNLITKNNNEQFKPFTQMLYVDLNEDPNQLPEPIPLEFRLGKNRLRELLYQYKEIEVNHLAFVAYFARIPVEDIVPYFPTHKVN